MSLSMQSNIRQVRFKIGELQGRLAVLEATKEDLERQIRKLTDSVPEDEVSATEQREGYVSYGSYAQSVIDRKRNLRSSLQDILDQHAELAGELQIAVDSLDSFERVRARRLASEAETALQQTG